MIERFWKCITFCRITASVSHKFCEIYNAYSDLNLVVTYSFVWIRSPCLLLGKRLILVCAKTLFILFNSFIFFESRSFTISSMSHSPLVQKGKPQRHFDVKMKFLHQNLLHSTSCYKSKNIIASRIVLSWKTLGNSTALGYLKPVTVFEKMFKTKLSKQSVVYFIP